MRHDPTDQAVRTAVTDDGPRLGKYAIVAELDRGGMGIVYLAVASGPYGFTKLVVIKRLLPALMGDPGCREMFLNEARVGAKLTHPNIVQTYEVGLERDAYFTVMEYLDGPSLHAVLKHLRGRGLPTRGLFLRVILEVLKALEYAHSVTDLDGDDLHIVHRDVTPHNVILTYDGHVKLFDFGISKSDSDTGQTQAGIVKGKAAYMAPEQAAGDVIDARTDLFTVGLLLWEALTGKRVWDGVKRPDIFRALLAQLPFRSPREIEPGISAGLEAVCMRALAYDPDLRYQTALEFHHALELEAHLLGEPFTDRDIAAMLSTEFAELRRQRRAWIETRRQIARTRPDVALALSGTFPTSSPPDGPGSEVGSSRIEERPNPTVPTVPSLTPFGNLSLPPRAAPSRLTVALGTAVPILALSALALVRLPATKHVLFRAALARDSVTVESAASPTAHAPAPAASPPASTVDGPSLSAAQPSPAPSVSESPPKNTLRTTPIARSSAVGNSARRAKAIEPTESSTAKQPAPPASASTPAPPFPSAATPPPVAPVEPVVVEPTATVPRPGTLTREQVHGSIRAHAGEVQQCYDRARMDAPDLRDRVGVRIHLSGDGRVSDVSIVSSSGGSTRLRNCLSSAIARWSFPAPAGGAPGVVPYTFVFE